MHIRQRPSHITEEPGPIKGLHLDIDEEQARGARRPLDLDDAVRFCPKPRNVHAVGAVNGDA